MNENDLPRGATLRRAVRWLSEQRTASPGTNIRALIEEASMRFDLSPLEAEYLFYEIRQARSGE